MPLSLSSHEEAMSSTPSPVQDEGHVDNSGGQEKDVEKETENVAAAAATTPPDLDHDLERSGTRASSVMEYSVFPKGMKRYIVICSSCAGFFSPLSSQIYFPALNTLASDLHVSIGLINLTLTSYMVCFVDLAVLHVLWLMGFPDIPRYCASLHWGFRRQGWQTTCVLFLLCDLSVCQYRAGSAEQLCRSLCPSMSAKCRQQHHYRAFCRRRSRCCDSF